MFNDHFLTKVVALLLVLFRFSACCLPCLESNISFPADLMKKHAVFMTVDGYTDIAVQINRRDKFIWADAF